MNMDLSETKMNIENVLNEVSKAIVGKYEILREVMASILSKGHILIEDYPGLAKTLMARSFSYTMGCEFKRIQFTPDLLPMDIIGSSIYDRESSTFKFFMGPVFTNILLADEINRAPPKTQSALLEAMQEYQVTVEGKTYRLDDPFIVIATQNPIEFEGTYPLPEAQMDRFLVRLRIGYPSKENEMEILKRRVERRKENVDLNTIITKKDLIYMQEMVENIHVDDTIYSYIVEIVDRTRKHEQLEAGSSPRGSLALLKLSRSFALMDGRDYVLPDDVKKSAIIALPHRLILKPEPWIRGVRPEDVVKKILENVPVPKI